jgi:hypothetical protein
VIENSVIGLRCRIGKNVVIRNSVILGSDFYETPADLATDAARGDPPLGIGEGTIIEGAIVDKNVHIGRRVRIVNEHHWTDTADCPRFMVRGSGTSASSPAGSAARRTAGVSDPSAAGLASCRTIGGQGRGAASIGAMPLLRARKSFWVTDPLGTGPE